MVLHPIHQAMEDNNMSEVQRLIREEPTLLELRNEEDDYTPLMLASNGGHEEIVAWLIDQGANIEAYSNGNRYTSLIIACRRGHLRVVSRLLEAGANMHTRDNNGDTILMLAVWYNRDDVVAFLLNQKGSRCSNDARMDTPSLCSCLESSSSYQAAHCSWSRP